MTVEALPAHRRHAWPGIREQRLRETSMPAPVRAISLPTPGGGTRMLGMPTVLERVIAPAILPVVVPIFAPDFSERRDGCRPGRSAHHALEQACCAIAAGYRWVVHMDREQFFDKVHQDLMMSRIARKVKATRLLRFIRRYLNAGIRQEGLRSQREAGMPQGSPLYRLLVHPEALGPPKDAPGWTVLATPVWSEVDTDAELLQADQAQHLPVEPGVRWIKHPAAISPVWLEKPERIAALAMLTVVGLRV